MVISIFFIGIGILTLYTKKEKTVENKRKKGMEYRILYLKKSMGLVDSFTKK